MDTASTILAVTSPPGRSLRGIVRISGAGAMDLLDASTISPATGSERFGHARRIEPHALTHFAQPLPALILRFTAPHSYTGEHCVEIQLPGNPVLLDRVVDAFVVAGRARGLDVRRAEPGEFTARAFFNGRISLTEAEGVAATIAARSDAELRAAKLLTGGRLGRMAESLAEELATALALLEAGIDFTDEEDVVAITPADLLNRVHAIRTRIAEQLDRAAGSESLEAIPMVVLAGAPNAGKSTLFNALLGHERAVVSPLAGTTRDVIAEPLRIDTPHGAAEVMLVDLAGLDPSLEAMNARMQSAARDAMAKADLILHCVPADAPMPMGGNRPADRELIVRTKGDLAADGGAGSGDQLTVCALTGRGLSELSAAIARRLADRAVSVAADAVVLNARHFHALHQAARNLEDGAALAAHHDAAGTHLQHPELVAAALRAALDDLGSLAGRITPDDILGRVFATFCIGK